MTGIGVNNINMVKVYPECEWAYRLFGVTVGFLFILSLALIAMTFRDNIIEKQFDVIMQNIYKVSANYGLSVDDVIVEGNEHTSYEDLVTALDLAENESILGINIGEVKQKIEQLTWVKSCVIKRSFFPNNILINIQERQVRAIWEYEGRFYPIDADGSVIEVEDYEPETALLQISGVGAPNNLKGLLDVVDQDNELKNRLKAAVFVSNRRWNLMFDNKSNGVLVKLPENDFKEAYKKISLLNKRKGIFKRKLTSFDVRYPNRIVVDVDKSVQDLILTR